MYVSLLPSARPCCGILEIHVAISPDGARLERHTVRFLLRICRAHRAVWALQQAHVRHGLHLLGCPVLLEASLGGGH